MSYLVRVPRRVHGHVVTLDRVIVPRILEFIAVRP
jgi:hypothetical protein